MKTDRKGLLTPRACLNAVFEDGRLDIRESADYAEPGYSSPKVGILFANWNAETKWNADTRSFDTIDNTMPRLAKIAEYLGFELEWSDEWATCDGCGKAVRTSGNSYGWTPSFWTPEDCGIICHECVDPDEYLEALEGHARNAITLDIDPAEHGYRKVNDRSYENGWHPGQNDSPEVIAKDLRARGITRFVFKIDDVGQFDMNFSVYVHEDECDHLDGSEVKSALPYDPGEEMGKALRGEPTEHYTVTTRTLTPEQFVKGDCNK